MTVENMTEKKQRPLLICDCDEVLLHMIGHFSHWLEETQDYIFDLTETDYSKALRSKNGDPVERETGWKMLNLFFDNEMHRQTLIAGADKALLDLSKIADIVILTNLLDHRQEARMAQLAHFGLHFPVVCNQGGKGEALTKILAEYVPNVVVFVDDLHHHHKSVGRHAPHVWRLQFVGEPRIADNVTNAATEGHAHARIDNWQEAHQWIKSQFDAGENAPVIERDNM